MSVGLAFWCDGQFQYGTCPKQITFSTIDLGEATRGARALKWSIAERTLCPECARLGR